MSVSRRKPKATAGAQDAPRENRRQVLDNAEHHRCNPGSGQAAHAAEHGDREDAADKIAADSRLDRFQDEQQCARGACQRDGDGEGDAFKADRIRAHESQRDRVL